METKMFATLTWNEGMSFECDNRGIKTFTEALPEHGGKGMAPTPKELVMNAMMGCTAMDVVLILKKMRQDFVSFSMTNDVEKTLEHPIHFKTSLLTFRLSGNLDADKVKKAVDSSLTKYCGVNYMISFSCEITYRIFLNDSEIATGKASFVRND
jgi:putative redox protein